MDLAMDLDILSQRGGVCVYLSIKDPAAELSSIVTSCVTSTSEIDLLRDIVVSDFSLCVVNPCIMRFAAGFDEIQP